MILNIIAELAVLISVHIIPGAITPEQTDWVLAQAEKRIEKQIPEIDIQYKKITLQPLDQFPFAFAPWFFIRYQYIDSYLATRDTNTYLKLIIDTPSHDPEKYIYGLACLGCYGKPLHNGGLAQAATKWTTHLEGDRREHAVLTVMHEIMHTLGCKHRGGINPMHPNALAFVSTKPKMAFRFRKKTKARAISYLTSLNG